MDSVSLISLVMEMVGGGSMDCWRCRRRVKNITIITVQIPSTEPIAGPAIQDLLSGGADSEAGRDMLVLVEVAVV